MKKICNLILFLVLITGAYAQRFEGGLVGGYNATQVDGDIYKGYNKPGILAGAFVQTDLAPAFFAGLEIKYSQKGSRNKIDPKAVEPKKYIMRLGYIDVPLYFGFRANDRISVVGGISAGYLIHAKEYNENGVFVEQDQHKFNNFDLEPFLGFQFDLLDRLKVDLRFAYSVVPIRGQPGENATTIYWLNNQFNKVISLALYYRLNPRKT
jgi:opacity protein-like surface antigen